MFAVKKLKLLTGWRGILAVGLLGTSFAAVPFAIEAAQSKAAKQRVQPAKAAPAPKPIQTDSAYDIAFKEFKLQNGLRVLLA